jgi:hypothetical protein
MHDNLLVYLNWNLLYAWRMRSVLYGTGKAPLGYGSSQRTFGKHVGKGSVLWVVTMPKHEVRGQPSRFYRPSLVARIRVARLLSLENCAQDLRIFARVGTLLALYDYVALADARRSSFFELNDVSRELARLRWQGKRLFGEPRAQDVRARGRTQALRAHIAQRLQSVRRIDADTIAPLVEHEEGLARKTVFISYAHEDGSRHAMDLADSLLAQGVSPWLDGLVVDPRLREREDVSRSLLAGLDCSELTIALVTPKYRPTDRVGFNWTAAEWEHALRRRRQRSTPCVQVDLGGRIDSRGDKTFANRRSVAGDIVRWWNARGG